MTEPNSPVFIDEVTEYVKQVFAPHDIIEFRALRERGGSHCIFRRAEDVPSNQRLYDWLEVHNQPGWQLYVGPNPRKTERGSGSSGMGTDTDVGLFRCVFVDFDDAALDDARQRIDRAGISNPTILISSGRPTGTHAYWCFDEPIGDAQEWRSIQVGLIRALNSDRAVKNPSRIMRLPGSHNHKWDAPCRTVERGQAYARWTDIGVQPADLMAPLDRETRSQISPHEQNLNMRTTRFLNERTEKGDRNNALFAAACDFNGNNFPFDEAHIRLSDLAVLRDGLSQEEATRVIQSAYRRDSQPSHVRVLGPEVSSMAELEAALNDGPVEAPKQPVSARPATQEAPPPPEPWTPPDSPSQPVEQNTGPDGPQSGPAPETAPETLHLVSNVSTRVVVANGRRQVVQLHKPIKTIATEVQSALDGFPRRSKATGLFACKKAGGKTEIWSIAKPDELFALLHDRANVRWASGDCESELGDTLSTVTKSEFFKWIRDNAEPSYEGVSELPHVPELPGMFYVPCDLPKPTGECLDKFVSAFNPATEVDRQLMIAALMTPGWGGSPGARPMFVFSSDYGQGAGKTATAKAVGSVWGGSAPLDYEDNWQNISKRIMSSEDWLSRVFLFDNVKGKFSGSAIEAAVTSEYLTGHKMFVGTVKRPNDATFFITFNMPEMSRDLAQRAIIIKLGPPRSGNFVEWSQQFVRDNRLQLIADILDLLKQPVNGEIQQENRDRWWQWQREVLSRVPGGNPDALASAIIDRRPVADMDADEAGEIVEALSRYLVAEKRKSGDYSEITAAEIVRVMTSSELWTPNDKYSPSSNARKCVAIVRQKLLGRGVLMPLEVSTATGNRPKKVRVDNTGRPAGGRSGKQSVVYGWSWEKASELADDDWDGQESITVDDLPI